MCPRASALAGGQLLILKGPDFSFAKMHIFRSHISLSLAPIWEDRTTNIRLVSQTSNFLKARSNSCSARTSSVPTEEEAMPKAAAISA